jgi:hypothetical protein
MLTYSEPSFFAVFVWVRWARNTPFRRCSAWAGEVWFHRGLAKHAYKSQHEAALLDIEAALQVTSHGP